MQPKPLMETPTQLPLQKTGRLQSVVTVVRKELPKGDSMLRDCCEDDVTASRRADGTFMMAPYHLIGSPGVIAEQFVLYCTDRFSRDDFADEVEDFGGVFGHRTAFIALLLHGDSGIFRSRLDPWREVDIPEYSARDGEDDVKTRRDSSCLTQGICEMHRRRCSGQMLEAVVLLLGAYAVLERRDDTLPVRWRREV